MELVKGTLLRTKAEWIAFFWKPIVKDFTGSCLWFLWLLCAFIALSSMVRENAVSLLVIMLCLSFAAMHLHFLGKEKHFFQDECVGLYWIVLVCFVEVMSAY
jgi:hypothetical protein